MSTNEPTGITSAQPPIPADAAQRLAAYTEHLRESVGSRIGPYRLLQNIGEGGFGTVFLAEQEKPVARRVALKIIKLGMDTRQVVARFEQERQALAMMDHPNIARVYDAGATETGRPYFVMELVRGDPIVEYCDKQSLSVRDRLELFAQVCSAVQHAHTKGIIHRDIKPSNVLVGEQDGRPSIKVIDFGIAKATGARLTEITVFTEHRQLIGTPEYMSPEQAEGSLDIDTRTDVYSLGVLLYELLTGTTPFSGMDLRSAAQAEIQRIIREVDPPKPSTRLNQSRETLAGVAASRHIEARKLGTLVRGELDWIAMKAMEKDRQRRYETASALGLDVGRYLAGEAVVAAPPSRSYRLKKFVRRNQAQVGAAALVALALVLGLAGTIWQASVASEQRDHARTEAARADERASAASAAEAEQRRLAESEAKQRELTAGQRDRAIAAEAQAKRRAQELQRVADFQGLMLAQIDPTTAGVGLFEDVRAKYGAMLTKAQVPEDQRSAQLEAFAGQWSRVNATDTATGLIDRTILKPAAAAIDAKFADQPAIAASLRHVLAERYYDLGLSSAALALEEQTLAQRRAVLGEDDRETLISMANLATYLAGMGRLKEAGSYRTQALERSRRVLGDDDPATIGCIAEMGLQLREEGRLREAEPLLQEALERRRRVLGEEHERTLRSINDWANLLQDQGKLAEAEPFFREVYAKRRRVLGEDSPDTLRSTNDLAVFVQKQGKADEATALFRDVVERKRRVLGEAHPSTLSSIQSLGATLDAAGHPGEAEKLMREALAKQQEILGLDHTSTLTTLGNLSVFLLGQNKFVDAQAMAKETLDRRRRVLGDNHTATLIANSVMGLVLIRQGKLDEGEPFWREALTIARRVLGPTHVETLTYTQNMGGLSIDRKDYAKAQEYFHEVIDTGGPALGAAHPVVLSARRRLGAVLLEIGRFPEAVEVLAATEPDARKAYTAANERYLATLLRDLGLARARVDDRAGAERNLIEAQALLTKVRGEAHAETRSCTRSLADFYAAWDKTEPGKGYDVKAVEWTARAEAGKER